MKLHCGYCEATPNLSAGTRYFYIKSLQSRWWLSDKSLELRDLFFFVFSYSSHVIVYMMIIGGLHGR